VDMDSVTNAGLKFLRATTQNLVLSVSLTILVHSQGYTGWPC